MWVCPTYGKFLDDVSSGLVIYRLIRTSRRRRGLVKVLVKVGVILVHRAHSVTMYCVLLYMGASYEQTKLMQLLSRIVVRGQGHHRRPRTPWLRRAEGRESALRTIMLYFPPSPTHTYTTLAMGPTDDKASTVGRECRPRPLLRTLTSCR
jgi:hypothetical protein